MIQANANKKKYLKVIVTLQYVPLKCLPLNIIVSYEFDNLLLRFTTIPA